jgi:excisionase family DNA binding protein
MGMFVPMKTTDTHTYLTVEGAAERVGVSSKTIRRWIKAGHLRAYRVGPKFLRIDPADLAAVIGDAA